MEPKIKNTIRTLLPHLDVLRICEQNFWMRFAIRAVVLLEWDTRAQHGNYLLVYGLLLHISERSGA